MTVQQLSRTIFQGIKRDLLTFWRYKAQVWALALEMLFTLGGFLLFGSIFYFSPEVQTVVGLQESDVFLFMATGAVLQLFIGISTTAPLKRVQQDVYYGTLEAVFVTPVSRLAYLIGPLLSELIIKGIFFIPIYLIVLISGNNLLNISIIGFSLLVSLISIINQMSIGIFYGMLAILYRQASFVITITFTLVQFLCGAFIPVKAYESLHAVIGPIIKYIAMAFPYTYSFDLIRYYMIGGSYITLIPYWVEYIILIGSTVLFFGLGYLLMIVIERKAKEKGLARL
jgi:ABC-2 type transport system permease protein